MLRNSKVFIQRTILGYSVRDKILCLEKGHRRQPTRWGITMATNNIMSVLLYQSQCTFFDLDVPFAITNSQEVTTLGRI